MSAGTPRPAGHPERVLVLAPSGRDAHLAVEVLRGAGLRAEAVPDIAGLCAALAEGAGCAVVAEEALRPPGTSALLAQLSRQPPWSDFPLVVLGESDASTRRDQRLADNANVTILERPFRMRTLLAAVQAAIRARRRQYDAERAIRDRDQFLALLGHELRNPLGAILLSLQLVANPGQRAGPALERHLAVLERQAGRLSRLVDDLLDVSRITSGKAQLRPRPTDLREAVERSAETMAAHANEVGVAVGLDLPATPVWLEADPVRLEQVFTNLLANAIKFTPAGGRVDVTVAVEGATAVARVRDTGVGIDPLALGRIFELFAQLEPTMDRSRGGLGIGLTLARSLAQLHGGDITAHSEGAGKGSTFVVRLPSRLAPPAAPAQAPARIQLGARQRRIVIVEDNQDIRATFRCMLEQAGHEVYEAADGPEGLQAILAWRPGVAFVDIGLPMMDGYEIARRVRARLGPSVRLVAVTGYGQPEDRRRAQEAGFDMHLTKPVPLAALQDALGEPGQRRGDGAPALPQEAPRTVLA